MPTFQRCDKSVETMAADLLKNFDTHHPLHHPLINAGVTIDYVFAYSDKDEKTGAPTNFALTKNGCQALGLTRKISLKDRTLGRADAEIALDGDWWKDAQGPEQKALLDHELHHLEVKEDKRGVVLDDLGRPCLTLRKHDFEIGIFNVIAQRHGNASQEVQLMKRINERAGQIYFAFLLEARTDHIEMAVQKARTA